MKTIFVDTAALVALGNQDDQWHEQAVHVSRQATLAGCRFITTDAVLLEVGNTFSRARYKPVALRLIQTARQSPRWHCVPLDSDLQALGTAQSPEGAIHTSLRRNALGAGWFLVQP